MILFKKRKPLSGILMCGLLWILLLPVCAEEENFHVLLQKGNAAFNSNDYVSASYYFNRLREREEWPRFSNRMDVFTKLAFIEESQSRFARAAEYYGLALMNLPESSPSLANLAQFYQKRYAETLEQAGQYALAQKIYWILFERSDEAERTSILRRLIELYGFQQPAGPERERLHTLVSDQYLDTLGWDLAELYRILGETQKGYQLFELLWPTDPQRTHEKLYSLIDTSRSLSRLDDFLKRLQALSRSNPLFFYPYLEALVQLNRGGEALELLEAYFKSVSPASSIDNAADLLAASPTSSSLLTLWIDLLEHKGRTDEAILRCRQIVHDFPMDIRWRERLSRQLAIAGNNADAVQTWKDWVDLYPNNPITRFNAIEKILELGDRQNAVALLPSPSESIAPPLQYQEGNVAMQLGLYPDALAAYHVTVASAGISPEAVVFSMVHFAETAPDRKPLMAALLQAATGQPFEHVPSWIRDALMEIGVKYGFESSLDGLAREDPSGLWKIHLSRTARKNGKTLWARALLESVTHAGALQKEADLDLSDLLGASDSLPDQRRAAELLRPSLAALLAATPPVLLSPNLLEHLFRYAEYSLEAYEPGEALKAVRIIESSSSTLQAPLLPTALDRLFFSRARAWTEMASFQPALEHFPRLQFEPYHTDALYYQALIQLALQHVEEARSLLQELVENSEHWPRANDALALLAAMEPLVGESQELFCTLQLYLLQGRYDRAVPVLRELAVAQYHQDTEEWARFMMGKLKAWSGDLEGARTDWEALLLDADHPVYHAMVQYYLARAFAPSPERIASSSSFQELLMDFPETLFADLARLEMQESIHQEQP